jgi:hypothetical protein
MLSIYNPIFFVLSDIPKSTIKAASGSATHFARYLPFPSVAVTLSLHHPTVHHWTTYFLP